MLNLKPLPVEGGYFSETYRSADIIRKDALPDKFPADRNTGTCIYYLLNQDTFSEFHTLAADEIYHFYCGDPVTLVQIFPDGNLTLTTLGSDLEAGQVPQVVVPSGVWQASYVKEGGSFALMGCTVFPGFDFADYQKGNWEVLLKKFPRHHATIMKLTRP